MGFNISARWKILTNQANEVNDPPLRYKNIVQNIEDKVAGGAQLVANKAARDAIPTAELYDGKRVKALDTRTEWEWNGATWFPLVEDTGWITLTPAPGFTVVSGSTFQVKRSVTEITFRGQLSGTFASGTNAVVAANGLPADFRPTTFRNTPCPIAVTGGAGAYANAGSGGDVNVITPAAGITAVYMTGLRYFVG